LSVEDFHNPSYLPVIQTVDVQRFIDSFNAWLHPDNKQPFIVIGPEGCGKGFVMLLPYQSPICGEIMKINTYMNLVVWSSGMNHIAEQIVIQHIVHF